MQILKYMKTRVFSSVLAVFLVAAFSQALSAEDSMSDRMDDGVEITRDAVDLETLIRDQPEDPNVLDTALILTNQTAQSARARCVAYNHLGEAEARAWVRLAGNGMRVFLASDIVSGRFVGSVRCKVRGRAAGSAFILGTVFSSGQVKNALAWDESRISMPVVVAF